MAAQVYFHLQSVPRTISRTEWYTTWRKVRMMQNTQRLIERSERELLRTPLPDNVRQDIFERMVNPPLLLGPWM